MAPALVPDIPDVVLPMPRNAFLPDDWAVPTQAVGLPAVPDDADDLARYRWWVGHQLAFCVWRMLSESLTSITRAERPSSSLVDAATVLYDAYSVLLLYTGSCSPEVYSRTIRPAMAAAHPAFSGRWARDYEPIPPLMRVLRRTRPSAAVDRLVAAGHVSQLVHRAIGKRLIPDSPSLLKLHGHDPGQPVSDAERDVFDAFFLLTRKDMTRRAFDAEVDMLTVAVTTDLTERPLDESAGTPDAPSPHAAATIALRRDSVAILRRLPSPFSLTEGHSSDRPEDHRDERPSLRLPVSTK